MSDDDKDEAIFRVDTVPPPAGEDDAYSAPTRVGPMAAAVVEEMMVASVRKAAQLNAAATEKAAASEKKAVAEAEAQKRTPVSAAVAPTSSKSAPVVADALSESDLVPDPAPSSRVPSSPRAPVASKPPPVPHRPAPPAVAAAPAAPPPRMYDEADDEENAATLLSRAAKAPVVQPTPAPQARSAPAFPAAPSAPVESPFAPSQNAAPLPASNDAALAPTQQIPPPPLQLPAFLPLAVGFAIFAIGLLLYFWAR